MLTSRIQILIKVLASSPYLMVMAVSSAPNSVSATSLIGYASKPSSSPARILARHSRTPSSAWTAC